MRNSSISGASGARRRNSRARTKPRPRRLPGHDGKFWDLETRLTICGIERLAGVDEAGRGPLAGPVVASAVILDPRSIPDGIWDSKRLNEVERERMFAEIRATALAVGIGVISPEVIDTDNILAATLRAMVEAVQALTIVPDCVVIDGRSMPRLTMPVMGLVKGDLRCVSVAAASIIAKVTRDRIMVELDREYPQYGFARNKGYGTADHLEALRRFGPSRIHRFSFEPVLGVVGVGLGE